MFYIGMVYLFIACVFGGWMIGPALFELNDEYSVITHIIIALIWPIIIGMAIYEFIKRK